MGLVDRTHYRLVAWKRGKVLLLWRLKWNYRRSGSNQFNTKQHRLVASLTSWTKYLFRRQNSNNARTRQEKRRRDTRTYKDAYCIFRDTCARDTSRTSVESIQGHACNDRHVQGPTKSHIQGHIYKNSYKDTIIIGLVCMSPDKLLFGISGMRDHKYLEWITFRCTRKPELSRLRCRSGFQWT